MEEIRYQIIIQFLEGNLSADQRKELAQWRTANPENEQQFKEVKFLWQKAALAKTKQPPIKLDVNTALAKVHQQLPKQANIVPLRRRFLRFAAVASILLFMGLMVWMTFVQPSETMQIATLANETRTFRLPDNSMVWLNENSSLSYPKNFDKKTRQVAMRGDIIFDVTPNKAKPFIVISDELTIKVLGTKFNIQSNKVEKKSATVHVLHGKVQVQKKEAPSEQVLLEKGMTALLDFDSKQLAMTDDFSSNQLFWQTKTLSFEANTLQEVMEDLRIAYHKELVITNPQVLSCTFTGTFTGKTLNEILSNLQLIYGFDLKSIDSQTLQLNQGICN